MNINNLIKKSQELHNLKTNKKNLFEALNNLDKTTLSELQNTFKPEETFQPVNLLRFLIAKILYRNGKVDEETINEIKAAIESRDISKYYDASIEYSKTLISYKNSKLGMFHQWKEPFIILFPFFYSQIEKKNIKEAINSLGNKVVSELNLKKVRIHTVDFYGSNNYGEDRIWLAIIPEEALNVQMAYQLFFSVNSNGIEGGLYCGHKMHKSNNDNKAIAYTTFEEYIKDTQSIIPKWEQLNSTVDFSIQKDEKNFKNQIKKAEIVSLQVYFQHLDKLIEDLFIPDKENLVFSTSNGQLSFQIGKRYCLNLKKDKFSFIAPDNYEVKGLDKEYFSEPYKASYFQSASKEQVESNFIGISQAVQNELDRDNNTEQKVYDNLVFRRAVFDKDYRQQFFNFEKSEKTIDDKLMINKNLKMTFPLNQILYGAPGTGKTYKTKEIAVQIITGKKINDRIELTKVYEELKLNNQINFTTFHQSISYEDFVEGIKPRFNDTDSNEISYEIKDGIFKLICRLESENVFSLLFFVGKRFENWEVKKVTSDCVHFEKPKGGILIMPLPLFIDLYSLIDELKIDFSLGNIHKDIEVDRVKYPYIERFYVNGYETLHKYIYQEYLKLKDNNNFESKKRVLIIDEINRGNVSSIFGELITLIEEDKRLGKKEALEVTLPYSKTKFGVPNNLYIIGTMNTADRSVESLDTALRRRFSFVEMQPDLDVLKEVHTTNGIISIDNSKVDMIKMLEIINKRIEILLNKDHQIGHSFFINTSSFEELKLVFKDKIIPLLEEYFFGDFGKIGLVLGESFIKNTNLDKKDIFAKFDDYEDRSLLTDKLVYEIKNPVNLGIEHFKAIYE